VNLNNIKLEHFRSFLKPTEFVLPAAGLYRVTGRNEKHPELEANACGKTTLFEAVHWCLFGKLSTGLKAGAVANWQSPRGCAVTLEGSNASDSTFILCRKWSPNSIRLNIKKGNATAYTPEVDQETLEKELGVNSDTFTYAYLFPQFRPSFLDLAPEQKMTLMVNVLRLEVWDRASKVAGDETDLLGHRISELSGAIGETQITSLDADLKRLKQQESIWEGDTEATLKGLVKQIDQARVQFAKKKTVVADLDQKNKDHKRDSHLLAAKHKLTGVVSRAMTEEARSSIHAENIRRVLSDLKTIKEGECPACHQQITGEHLEIEIKRLKVDLAKAVQDLKKKAEVLASAEQALDVVETKILKEQEVHEKTAAGILEARNDLHKCQTALEVLAGELKHTKATVNPYTEQVKVVTTNRFKARLRQAALKQEMAEIRENINKTGFWIKGFKEVRLLVVEDMITQLEAEVNHTIHNLGLTGWQILFDIEKETKSGTIRRGFTTMVLSPDNKEAVPWEAWSGGESQRLRLAGMMGFANVVHAASGQFPNFEFWDEPSTWLSDKGIKQMLDALNRRAQQYKRTILVADHRALAYPGFAGTITVVKDQQGSRIE